MKDGKPAWHTYIVRCRDDTLYTGIAVDPENRVEMHNSAKGGARYTRSRRPVCLVYREPFSTRSDALKREHEIKKLKRDAKLELIRRQGDGHGSTRETGRPKRRRRSG